MVFPTRNEMTVLGRRDARTDEVLTGAVLGMVRRLHASFDEPRRALLGPTAASTSELRGVTWESLVDDHLTLLDVAARGSATAHVRPRALGVDEAHVLVRGVPVAGALVDLAMFLTLHAQRLLQQGSAPVIVLPALRHEGEEQWWLDVLATCERWLALPAGTIRTTQALLTLPTGRAQESAAVPGPRRSYAGRLAHA